MYTVMESLTQDGRDRSLDYKISGILQSHIAASRGFRLVQHDQAMILAH